MILIDPVPEVDLLGAQRRVLALALADLIFTNHTEDKCVLY